MIAPMIYGAFMDRGEPRALFLLSAASRILCIGTVFLGSQRRVLSETRRGRPVVLYYQVVRAQNGEASQG